MQRGLLILLGFSGVLLVVQPSSEGFNVYAWIAVLATLFHATRDTLTRAIGLHVPALLITLSTAVSVALAAGGITLTQTWTPVDSTSLTGNGWLGLNVPLTAQWMYIEIATTALSPTDQITAYAVMR